MSKKANNKYSLSILNFSLSPSPKSTELAAPAFLHRRFFLPPGGEILLFSDFLSPDSADKLFYSLTTTVPFETGYTTIFGKKITQPRLTAWFGDHSYRYSGYEPSRIPFTEELEILKRKCEFASGHPFNGVLLNFYRDHRDSMGWHADNEKSLGLNPVIASVSLGESRLFKIRRKRDKFHGREFSLTHGSLLVMRGDIQHHWEHCLPKVSIPQKARLNLTFRRIASS